MSSQKGAALLVSLIILLILSVIGISAVRGGLLQTLISANAQQSEMAFSVADAGVSGVIQTAKVEGTSDGGILSSAISGTTTRYIDKLGVAVAEEVKMDSDRLVPVMKAVTETSWNGCIPLQCAGFSLKADSDIGCHSFRIDSEGSVSDVDTSVSQWASVVAAGCSTD